MTKFIDSNVIVKAFTANKDKEKCQEILQEEFITTALCLIEAQRAISIILKDKILASKAVKSLFKKGTIAPLDANLIFESFKRIDKYNLDIFDLVNYASALLNNCTEFVSYDRDFNNLEIKRIEP